MNTLIDAPIIAGPLRAQNAPRAMLSLVVGDDPYWIAACKPGLADSLLASRMLALLRLHRTNPLLHPVFVPTHRRPALALFGQDGSWTDHRNLAVPVEVTAEVDRIAGCMRSEHGAYVHDFIAGLSGKGTPSLQRVPKHLRVKDPSDEYWLVPAPPMVPIDATALGPWGTPEFFAKLVGIDYQRDRYLERQTDEVLRQRATDAVVNIFEIEGERQLVVNLADLPSLNAMARLGEVMEELRLRHGALPANWIDSLATDWGGPGGTPERTRKALDSIATRQGYTTDGLVKFGKISHLRDSIASGTFRVRPASSYQDPSLNRAQVANELEFEQELDVRKLRFRVLDPEGAPTGPELQPIRAAITRRSPTDAYVFCASRRMSARLFHDFEADACLLIHDRRSFLKRLAQSTRSLLPNWQMVALDVRYIDPFSPEARDAMPLFDKASRYQYQSEHRVLWLPPQPRRDLEPVVVELGSLADIAELIPIGGA